MKVGDKVLVDMFDGTKFVDIAGTSKGRGFAGVVKRHKFAGGRPRTATCSRSGFDRRIVVSVARVPGMRMSGHMGDVTVTVRNLRVLGVDKEENLLVVEGAVPGARNGYLVITKAKKPPRERRGFSGDGTVDPLKASKRAARAAIPWSSIVRKPSAD